jgi:cell volume regulation protein A
LDFANHAVLIGAVLVMLSILASVVAQRTGAPLLLVFLGIGMMAGAEGAGGIQFQNFESAYLVGTIALAVILFDGGMRTRAESSRVGLRPALSLATIGVVLTTGMIGLAVSLLLDFDWRQGLLIGAIVGSTDAAAVFSLLHSRDMHLKQRVGTTLEIESGCNDPMAVFLTLLFVTVVQTNAETITLSVLGDFVYQFGLGGVIGLGGGRALAWLISRINLTVGLYPLLAAAGGLTVYGVTTIAGASGFLAIYVAGLVLVANHPVPDARTAGDTECAVLHMACRPAGGGGVDFRGSAAGGVDQSAAVLLSMARTGFHWLGRIARCGADRAGAVSDARWCRRWSVVFQYRVLRRARVAVDSGLDGRAAGGERNCN